MTTIATLMFLMAILLAGCTSTNITHTEPTFILVGTNWVRSGGGFTVVRKTRMAKHTIADLQIAVTTNGATFGLQGYQSDEVQAIGVAVDSAVKAAISSATGKPN